MAKTLQFEKTIPWSESEMVRIGVRFYAYFLPDKMKSEFMIIYLPGGKTTTLQVLKMQGISYELPICFRRSYNDIH